jgi:hypothetical protein
MMDVVRNTSKQPSSKRTSVYDPETGEWDSNP